MKNQNLPTTWDEAAKLMNVDPTILPDVSLLPERLKKFVTGMFKRAIVVEALNKAAGAEGEKRWKPDYMNGEWDKYYPYARPGKDAVVPSGFGFSNTGYGNAHTTTYVGSRLELRNSDLVQHMFDSLEFREILADTMVIHPDEE